MTPPRWTEHSVIRIYRVILQTREVGLGGLMLDIGANTGRMAVPRAILGDVTAVYCAEPDLLNYQCLVRNVRDNHLTGLVLPDHLAVASEDGVVRLERAKTTGGHRVIDQGVATTRTVTEVPALTVDSWMDRLGIAPEQVAFVKVDVQGSKCPCPRAIRAPGSQARGLADRDRPSGGGLVAASWRTICSAAARSFLPFHRLEPARRGGPRRVRQSPS